MVSEHENQLDNNVARVVQIFTLNSFLSACHNGDLGNVKKILSKDKELVNQKFQKYGLTGLQMAAFRGHSNIVFHLIKNGANLELTDNDGNNLLHYTVAGNQAHMIEDLIKAGIPVDARNEKERTPLHSAAERGHLDCVKMLLKYKANINVQGIEVGNTPLHYAIVKRNDEMIDLLLNVPDVDVTLKNHKRISILSTAAIEGNIEVARRILEKAPGLVDEKDRRGVTALHFCCATGDKVEMLKILVEQGRADIDIKDSRMRTPLHLAAIGGFTKNIEYLIKCGAKVSTQNSFGDTPLHDAITERNNPVVDLLIKAPGIDLAIENKDGFSAFHFSILRENSYVFEKLLQKAPHLVNFQKNTDGPTCLHIACLSNRYQMMKTLIEEGQANIEITTLDNSTPLHFAVEEGYCRIIELLVTHQANVNAQDIKGNTPLHVLLVSTARNNTRLKDRLNSQKIASIWNHLWTVGWKSDDQDLPYAAVCCFLVSAGADYGTKKNNRGQTALDLLPSRFREYLHLYATDPKLKISFDLVAEAADTGNGSGSAASSDNEVKMNEAVRGECLACSEVAVLIQFEPCDHRVVCEPCSVRMKKCFDCKKPIQRKVNGDGKEVTETKADCCSICTVKKKNVMFLCGHSACQKCSDALVPLSY